jgi:diguanylate cyclase (GGDEF)-like protein
MTAWLDEASGFLGGLVRWGEAARRRAITDELSGLFNRRFLEETIRMRFARGSSSSRRCSLLMLDIDHFREVNATFGPQAGDAVISTVATAFGRVLGDGEVAARLSGDEFAIFLPGSGPQRAMELAELLRAEAQALYLEFRAGPEAARERAEITVSVGVASCPEQAIDAEALFAAADQALYRAKEDGRNRIAQA